MVGAAKLVDVPVGESPTGGDYPLVHRSYIRRREGRPTRRKPGSKSLLTEASNSAGRSVSEPVGSPEMALVGSVEPVHHGRRPASSAKGLGVGSRWTSRGL